MPTRVLNIGELPQLRTTDGRNGHWNILCEGSLVRLVHSRPGQVGRYVALSYCWGPTLPVLTTTANLQAHQDGIDFAALPKTLQDAITMARYLGFQYIWIDCLCIIQDQKKDWSREAASMATIYSNAHLTVAAAGSAHCDGGMLNADRAMSAPSVSLTDETGDYEIVLQDSAPGYVFDIFAVSLLYNLTSTLLMRTEG